jgi:hypothetical protein
MILLPFAILAAFAWSERHDLMFTFADCFLAEPWAVIYKEGCNAEN